MRKLGELGLGALARLLGMGALLFGAWGIAMAVLLHWLETHWPAEGRR